MEGMMGEHWPAIGAAIVAFSTLAAVFKGFFQKADRTEVETVKAKCVELEKNAAVMENDIANIESKSNERWDTVCERLEKIDGKIDQLVSRGG